MKQNGRFPSQRLQNICLFPGAGHPPGSDEGGDQAPPVIALSAWSGAHSA